MRFRRQSWTVVLALTWCALTAACATAGELGVVPFFDGERTDALNLWGGPFSASVSKQTAVVRSGNAALQANLGTIADGSFKFFQTFSSGTGLAAYRQDRNLARYDSLGGYVRNDTGVDLRFSIELKDYRDSSNHRAVKDFVLPAGGTWQPIETSLDLAGWNVTGSPDLSRTFAVSFLVNADYGAGAGSLYLDDFSFVEKGPGIDTATADVHTIVERLAQRQFDALWTARHKTSGLVPNISTASNPAALNTTTGMVWNLPSAIRRGWVTQAEADTAIGQLVATLNNNRNQTTYLPTRFLDYSNGNPTSTEESSIDASFLFLALHNYKTQEATPQALRDGISALQNRFNWGAFARPNGWNLAYNPNDGGFTPFTYSGYTNEGKVITLAGELSDAYHTPLETMWNKDVGRVLASLVDPQQNHLVYSYSTEYRAPFSQALINLFVDTSQRGADNYPTRNLARNPWMNFVRYEAEVAAYLDQQGREYFLQPDAARGPGGTYNAWNLYHNNNFGQPELFQPWSVTLALLAGAPGAEEAFRYLLDNGLGTGLDGPLGLADWALWPTDSDDPTQVPTLTDNWNMTLSLMAMMEFIDGQHSMSRYFANLPQMKAALDNVFVAGDYNGNGTVDVADFNYWKSTFGSRTLLAADGNNNGIIDAGDYTIWQDNVSGGAGGLALGVPEPAIATLLFQVLLILAIRHRIRRKETGVR